MIRIGAGAEVGVVVVGDLGDDRLDRLGLDPGLGRVVDAARQVAVRRDVDGGGEQLREHRGPLVSGVREGHRLGHYSACRGPPDRVRTRCARAAHSGSPGCTARRCCPTLRPGDRLLVRYAAPVAAGRARAGAFRRRDAGGQAGRRARGDAHRRSPAGGCSATTPTRASTRATADVVAEPTWSPSCWPGSGRGRDRGCDPAPAVHGRRDLPERRTGCATVTSMAASAPGAGGHPFAGDPVFDLHVGGKMEVRSTVALTDRDGPLAGLHARRRPGLRGHRRRPGADPALHVGPEHRRGRHRRHRGARAR